MCDRILGIRPLYFYWPCVQSVDLRNCPTVSKKNNSLLKNTSLNSYNVIETSWRMKKKLDIRLGALRRHSDGRQVVSQTRLTINRHNSGFPPINSIDVLLFCSTQSLREGGSTVQDAWMQIKLCWSLYPRLYLYLSLHRLCLSSCCVCRSCFYGQVFISPGTTGRDNDTTPFIKTRTIRL